VIEQGMSDRLDERALQQVLADIARAELGDERRVARAQRVVERLSANPGASLPDAMVTDAELEGAYRLFSNEEVTFEKLVEAHAVATYERARDAKVVLAIHDTTPCQFSHADPAEVGYLSTGKPGFQLHYSLIADTRTWKRPLGVAYAETLARDTPPRRRGTKHRHSSYKSARANDKEFDRWWRGIEAVGRRCKDADVQVIHVADRETDSYELMAKMIAGGHRFIVRVRHDRTMDDGVRLYEKVAWADVVLEREVPLSRRLADPVPRSRRDHPPREARTAKLQFAPTTVVLRRPHCALRELPAMLTVNVLHVYEIDSPDGESLVEWLLYTTEPLDQRDQIEAVVDHYRCRWLIEELNKALKTGCVVQERQLESLDAITTMLALSLPIAVELLAMRTLARTAPSHPAEELFSREQLAALRHISHRPVPEDPTVGDVLWCIAGLGGHIKNNGWPGWQVLQRGMEKFLSFAAGWCARAEAEM
jgi:hypothetical protein